MDMDILHNHMVMDTGMDILDTNMVTDIILTSTIAKECILMKPRCTATSRR